MNFVKNYGRTLRIKRIYTTAYVVVSPVVSGVLELKPLPEFKITHCHVSNNSFVLVERSYTNREDTRSRVILMKIFFLQLKYWATYIINKLAKFDRDYRELKKVVPHTIYTLLTKCEFSVFSSLTALFNFCFFSFRTPSQRANFLCFTVKTRCENYKTAVCFSRLKTNVESNTICENYRKFEFSVSLTDIITSHTIF